MKKYFSILLVIAMVLSMIPFAYGEGEGDVPTPENTPTPDNSTPVQIASPQATFTYTQGKNTITEIVEVDVYDLSGKTTESSTVTPIDNVEAREYQITVEKNDGDSILEKTHDTIVTDGEEIITQTGTSENKAISTVVGDPGEALSVEKDDYRGYDCNNHSWDEGQVIQEATCGKCGIIKYHCINCKTDKEKTDYCAGVKYEEIPKDITRHELSESPVSTVGCVEKRYRVFRCYTCNEYIYKYDDSIEKAEHTYVDGICTKCGDVVKTQGTIETNGPTYSYENSVLIVNGSGAIPDYKITVPDSKTQQTDIPLTDLTPWAEFASKVIEIIIGSGITRIGDFAFANMVNLQQVDIYSKNVTVGDYAFAEDANLENVNFMNKEAEPTFENSNSKVSYKDDAGNTSENRGSTAFADDGNVSVNYSCVDPHAPEMKATQKFAFTTIGHTDLHLNCATLPGVAPTETEPGKTEGVYCNDCKKTIVIQTKIYPNGKQETGEYAIKALSELTSVPKSLENTKYNTMEKIAELITKYDTVMADQFETAFNCELPKGNSTIYDIELVKSKTEVIPDKQVVNIPYPTGTNADNNEFLAVQLNKEDEVEKIDTFLTNKGIQIEVETLMPVGVAWKSK